MIATDLPGWALRMVTASFKGNNFLTESHDQKGGRRLVVHEYPGAEEPVVEDLGGKAGEFRLNAYFIGADYDLARDQFLATLNKPGADWLAHPWRGNLWVRAHNWSAHEKNDKGGYCEVSVDFVPGGSDTAMPTADRTDIATAKVKNFKDTVQGKFQLVSQSAASLNNMIAKVQAKLDGVRNILALVQLPLTMISQVRNVIDGIKGDVASLLALPADYATQLRSFSDLLGVGPSDTAAPATNTSISSNTTTATSSATIAATPSGIPVAALPQVVDTLLALTDIPVTHGGAGDSPALHINLSSEKALFGQLMLASAVEVALADYQSADDRDAVLSGVLMAMDRMLPDMDDDVFQAALDCRATLIDALLAQQLEPAQVRDIVQPLPATLLAHRMEVDEAVFLARNKVRHPLFVRGRVYG